MSPPCPLQERHHTKAQYQLKSDQISLAQVFSKMEQVVDVLGIEDYSVSQTTLDNVRVGTVWAAGCLSPGRVAVPRGGCVKVPWGSHGGVHGGSHSPTDVLGPVSSGADGRRGAARVWRCSQGSLAASCPFCPPRCL